LNLRTKKAARWLLNPQTKKCVIGCGIHLPKGGQVGCGILKPKRQPVSCGIHLQKGQVGGAILNQKGSSSVLDFMDFTDQKLPS
jgi:hypothetical protein